jgi:lysophospholipase L1-like esterase
MCGASIGCTAVAPDEVEPPVPPALAAPSVSEQSRGLVRIVLFGDSNTDCGWRERELVACSYISSLAPLSPTAPHSAYQLAGMVAARSTAGTRYEVVNHGLSGTGTGDGRYSSGSPNARFSWQGCTRFEAEVLGTQRPTWTDGEGRPRVQAFVPTVDDYVYVSMGTNDLSGFGIDAAGTIANLRWMADRWVGAGLPASHFIVTTLPPRPDASSDIPAINPALRHLAATTGISLIDLAAFTTADDGVSWRSNALQIGDGLHYRESTRRWLTDWIVATIAATE